jgi:hypothetical protein
MVASVGPDYDSRRGDVLSQCLIQLAIHGPMRDDIDASGYHLAHPATELMCATTTSPRLCAATVNAVIVSRSNDGHRPPGPKTFKVRPFGDPVRDEPLGLLRAGQGREWGVHHRRMPAGRSSTDPRRTYVRHVRPTARLLLSRAGRPRPQGRGRARRCW